MRSKMTAIFTAVLLLSSTAHAREAVRPIPGVVCLSLDATSLAAKRQSGLPRLFSQPSLTAPPVGYPTSIVFVHSPAVQQNGFEQVLRLNGSSAWIEADHLRPWHSPNGGNARCVPSFMSDGRLGTSIH